MQERNWGYMETRAPKRPTLDILSTRITSRLMPQIITTNYILPKEGFQKIKRFGLSRCMTEKPNYLSLIHSIAICSTLQRWTHISTEATGHSPFISRLLHRVGS